jgi:retinol-binding protein 3
MTGFFPLAAAAFFVLIGQAPSAGPEAARAAAPAFDGARARELAESAAGAIDSMYVDAAVGRKIAARIRERAAAGAYDGAGTLSSLADVLTRDLQEFGNDRHLMVRFDPAFSGGPRIRRGAAEKGKGESEPLSPRGDGRPIRIVRGPGPGPGDSAETDARRRANFGFRSVERLDGNVGLVDIRGLHPLASSKETAASAMAFVANTDAVILDLRDCPGGSPDTVSFLASYFFGPERRELYSRYDRVTGETTTERTAEELPGRRMPDTDLWILVGPSTASAGESLAYLLQQFGRATVVGERTAGAGHNNVLLPIGDGLVLSVSVGRPIHPRTGKGWEGEGVKPDVGVPAGTALAVAHAAALKRLEQRSTDDRRRRELAWAIERVDPARPRPRLSAADLDAYSGRYGERSVAVEAGRLVCRGATGRALTLEPIGRDAFTWDENTRATFGRDSSGRPAELVLERADGTIQRFARAPAASAPAAKEMR